MDELIKLAQQVGFPVVVALFLLIRYDGRLKEMTDVLARIATSMEIIKDHIQKEG